MKALFLDRDGVLNIDYGYVHKPSDFQVINGVFNSLRWAQDHNYALIVVTNQSGIARGFFSFEEYIILEEHMTKIFADQGIFFHGIYFCPHHPLGTIPELSFDCACRKPKPGLFHIAAQEHAVDMERSIMVGDRNSDLIAARSVGIARTHLVSYPAITLGDLSFD